MDEEKKVYSFIGTVTIGTDEYRDLIEDKAKAISEKDDYYRRYWDLYSKNTKLEEQVKELSAKVEQLRQYIRENNEQDSFELWILRSSRGE